VSAGPAAPTATAPRPEIRLPPPLSAAELDPGALLDRVIAAIPGGEDRPQQREMTDAVHRAFRAGDHLAIQGPTGVGKSIAYLLPAIVAARRGVRTVVVTSSKALQDQLASVELPFLAETLGHTFTYAVLKGRSNYLCEAAAAEARQQLVGADQQGLDLGLPPAASGPALDRDELREQVEQLLEWAEHTEAGDMAELDATPDWAAWSAVSVGPGECLGAGKCDVAAECWSEKARTRAEHADIVVVNAHLYGAHIQTGGSLLPPHTQVVIDEAHEFEDSIVGSLSVELTEGRLANLARVHDRCVAGDEKVARTLRSAGDMLEATLEGLSNAGGPGTAGAAARAGGASGAAGMGTVRLPDGLGDDLSAAVSSAAAAADRALNSLRVAAKNAGETRAKHRIERAVRTAEAVVNDAQALLGKLGPGTVLWVESTRGHRHALRLTRIDVAATLRARAWDDEDLTVVCCSATLDRCTARRLGLDAEFVAVESPFNFRDHAVLYVPKVARPNHPDWPEQVADVIEHLIRRCDGRTLALFTSTRMLRATVERCRERLDGFTILAQGDAPNPVLQEQFVREEHTSLFATASFWTGMSSPGTTCSAVVVDKLPFPVPTDPIVEARCDLVGDAAFAEVSVPAAGMQLAQGVGRLIRTANDRGVVAVCDPRLAEARYRNRMLDLLPPMRRARNRDFVDRFIDSLELTPR
jgi:ATP-dependent DNA helicase DinG